MRVITNGSMAISVYPKCASTNLIQFFEERTIPQSKARAKKLFKDSKEIKRDFDFDLDIHNKKNCTLIVVTRNEIDRWCSGVVEDIDNESYILFRNNIGQLTDKIKKALTDITQYKNLFMGMGDGHSHVGQLAWNKNIVSLCNRPNTHFIDISSLSDKKFWMKICEIDSEWPPVDDWWDVWEKEFKQNDCMDSRTMVTGWVKHILYKHENLLPIRTILESNQEMIESLKDTRRWFNYD
tara:strand:- start:624 stop:1337 length:714 start_codon:yes stop_codon:yes gene_type:complete